RWTAAAGRAVVRSLVAAALLYLAFLAAWGLNYRRMPLVETLQFDRAGVTPELARGLAATAINRANTLHAPAHLALSSSGGPGATLAIGFAAVQRELGALRLARPGRPKGTLLDLYFRRAGVEGMTDPFFLETLVTGD